METEQYEQVSKICSRLKEKRKKSETFVYSISSSSLAATACTFCIIIHSVLIYNLIKVVSKVPRVNTLRKLLPHKLNKHKNTRAWRAIWIILCEKEYCSKWRIDKWQLVSYVTLQINWIKLPSDEINVIFN